MNSEPARGYSPGTRTGRRLSGWRPSTIPILPERERRLFAPTEPCIAYGPEGGWRAATEIDHCFPFAAWPCNDLWNLLPSNRQTNQNKSDRLPSPEALDRARPRLLDWWDSAYQTDVGLKATFEDEARSALPASGFGEGQFNLESLFEGLMYQQRVLKRDQQLREWQPLNP